MIRLSPGKGDYGMNRRTISVITAICIYLMGTSALISADTLISEHEAKARAREFCRKVGWKAGDVPVEKMKAKRSERAAGRPSERGDDRWDVTIGEFDPRIGELSKRLFHVDVDSHTGEVMSAAQLDRHMDADKQRTKDSIKITKTLANQRAKKYLRDAGIPADEMVIESSEPSDSIDYITWNVRYRRTYKGYQFLLDGGRVDLDPLDGSLIGFGYGCFSPIPESTDVKITKAQAVERAREYLAEFGLTAGGVSSYVHPGLGSPGGLKIVPHDDMWEYWDVGQLNLDWNETRLAWELEFDAPWNITRVYVDAENGSIVSMLTSWSESKPRQAINEPALVGVDQIKVAPADGSKQATTLSGTSDDGSAIVGLIHSLKRSSTPDAHLPVGITISTRKRTYTFGYSAAGHRLVLLTKVWDGKTIKGNLAWETTNDFEELLGRYIDDAPAQ